MGVSSQKGFTIIELIVVIAIIAVLSGIVMMNVTQYMMKARNAARKEALRQVQKALELYFSENGSYPITTGDAWWGECTNYGSHPLTGATGYVPGLAPDYIGQLPLDPKGHNADGTSGCYIYRSVSSNGVAYAYKLMAYHTPEGTFDSTDPFYDSYYNTSWVVCGGVSVCSSIH